MRIQKDKNKLLKRDMIKKNPYNSIKSKQYIGKI